MKLSAIMCASVLALAATALIADGALAATVTTTRSNTFPVDPEAAAACTNAGGVVSTDQDRGAICTLPDTGATARQTKCRTWQFPFEGLNIQACLPCPGKTCNCAC